VPRNWSAFRDTVSANFRIISRANFRLLNETGYIERNWRHPRWFPFWPFGAARRKTSAKFQAQGKKIAGSHSL
jgi:hypothetical protein